MHEGEEEGGREGWRDCIDVNHACRTLNTSAKVSPFWSNYGCLANWMQMSFLFATRTVIKISHYSMRSFMYLNILMHF